MAAIFPNVGQGQVGLEASRLRPPVASGRCSAAQQYSGVVSSEPAPENTIDRRAPHAGPEETRQARPRDHYAAPVRPAVLSLPLAGSQDRGKSTGERKR